MKAWISENKPLKVAFMGSRPSPMSAVITLVFISLLATTVIAGLFVRSNRQLVSQRNLEDAVNGGMDSITIELTQGISQLRAIQGLFNASEIVTREEFDIFVSRFLAKPHEVPALEWIARVPASQKEQYINRVRHEGFEGFTIHPETQFQDLFPATYLAPFAGNVKALSFDLYSEEVRRAALIKAWETGVLTITEPITLVQ